MSEQLLNETRNEIEVLNRLRHPHIIGILGVLWTPPELILVFERMDYSLYHLLHVVKKKLDKPSLKRILLSVATALEFIHFCN
mmetsp:Transcript_66410/g.143274  ORF Transcript_66410/g.143274 Transcript_66410/m.143274 type:complete len:83 (-) Transcript_66410:557-805(-)